MCPTTPGLQAFLKMVMPHMELQVPVYLFLYIFAHIYNMEKGGIIRRGGWTAMLRFTDLYACDVSAVMEQADEQ